MSTAVALQKLSPRAWAVSRDTLVHLAESLFGANSFTVPEGSGGNSGSLDRQQAEAMLLGLTAARLGPLMAQKGWKNWSRVEALAAFELMDKDGDERITLDEFTAFLASNPFFFGPLLLIERLFRAYDQNDDGKISEEELFTMLLDIEIEQGPCSEGSSSFEGPDLEALQLRARHFVNDFDAAGTAEAAGADTRKGSRDGELDFINFVHLVHRHPELVVSVSRK